MPVWKTWRRKLHPLSRSTATNPESLRGLQRTRCLGSGLESTSKAAHLPFLGSIFGATLTRLSSVGWVYSYENSSTVVPMLMAEYRSLVQQIYDKGGRNFLFLNVPPTSRSPYILASGLEASREHAAWLSVYNEGLKLMAMGFQDDHPDVCSIPVRIDYRYMRLLT